MKASTVMKKLSMATVGAALIALGTGGAAQATVLTFDDISPIDDYASIPNGYGGLDWDNFSYLNSLSIPNSGYNNGIVSGNYVAFNVAGDPAIVGNGVFDFNSAYLTAAWNNSLSITVEGLNNGSSLYSTTVVVDTNSPILFDFDYRGINELRFTSFGGDNAGFNGRGTQFAMDNFNFTPVPEPASVLGVLAFGALGASSLLKRKQQKKA